MNIYIYYILNPPLELAIGRTSNPVCSTRKNSTGRALPSKSLLGHAPQPLAARTRWSGVPRGHLALESTSSTPTALENTAQGVLCARNHCSAVLRGHWPLEIAARACREATLRSKSPLEYAFSCSATLTNAAARASVVGFDNTFALPAESLSKSLLKSLCFELCIASTSALLRAVHCATPQAPSGAICGAPKHPPDAKRS